MTKISCITTVSICPIFRLIDQVFLLKTLILVFIPVSLTLIVSDYLNSSINFKILFQLYNLAKKIFIDYFYLHFSIICQRFSNSTVLVNSSVYRELYWLCHSLGNNCCFTFIVTVILNEPCYLIDTPINLLLFVLSLIIAFTFLPWGLYVFH